MIIPLKTDNLPAIANIDKETFFRDYVVKGMPVVLQGYSRDWPALKKWTLDYLGGLGSQNVILEQGNVMQHPTKFHSQSLDDYIEEVSQTPDSKDPSYLSMYKLLEDFPSLKDDVDFSLLDKKNIRSNESAWIGPSNTVTGFHFDRADNLFAQIIGEKEFLLVSSSERERMYPSRKYDPGGVLSRVDLENFDERECPVFRSVKIYKHVLEPGDVLFIPKGWWHHVRSLTESVSINSFFQSRTEYFLEGVRERVFKTLYRFRLYGEQSTMHHSNDRNQVRDL